MGYMVEEIDGPYDLISNIDNFSNKQTIIFNKCRGFIGLERKIYIPSICNLYQIPMIGSSAYVVTLARHKFHSNRLVSGVGLKVPKAIISFPGDKIEINNIKYPVITKPNYESGALGISEESVQSDLSIVRNRVEYLHNKFNQPVIIEEFIEGEELKISVIGNRPSSVAVGCVGVMKDGKPIIGSIQTHQDLKNHKIEYYKPKKSNLIAEAMNTAKFIHDVFECSDYSRCDFRINRRNQLVFMELSTHPDIGRDSSFISAALQTYDSYERIIESIVYSSLKRYGIHKISF